MKKHNKLEDKMKSLSDNEKVEPPAFVWENIESTLVQGKKKRRFLFWLVLGIATVSFGFASITKLINSNIEPQHTLLLEEKKLYAEDDKYDASIEKSKEEYLALSPSKVNMNNGIVNSLNGLSNHKNNITESEKSKEKKSTSSYELKSTKPNITTTDTDQKEVSTDIEKSKYKVIARDIYKGKEVDRSESNSSITPEYRAHEKFDVATIGKLKLLIESRPRMIPSKEVTCPNFSKGFKIDFFVELSGLAGTQSKRFGSTQLTSLAMDRSITELSFIGYGASLAGGFYLNNNMYIMTGLDWFNSVDKFNFEREGLTKVIINYNVETNKPIDTTFVTGTIRNSGYINYRTIDVPITFGLRKLSGSWSFGFEIGGVLNLAFATKGKILSSTGDVSTILNEFPVYKDKLGLGIKSSLVLGRYLGYGVSLQSKLSYKNYLKEVNHSHYDLPTKFQFMRLEIGLRKEF